MSGDGDLMKLYSARILALAAELPAPSELELADATASRRAPLCGSTIKVSVALKDGLVQDFAQNVKACALGQAAASVVAKGAVGASVAEIMAARDALSAMLRENGAPPNGRFSELETLLPAREFGNRHASIMLSLDATVDALTEAQKTAVA